MSTEQTVFAIIFAAVGSLSLLGAIRDWDWFFESSKAAFFVKIMGRKGARIFYGILGTALIGFAIYGSMHPEIMHSRRYGI